MKLNHYYLKINCDFVSLTIKCKAIQAFNLMEQGKCNPKQGKSKQKQRICKQKQRSCRSKQSKCKSKQRNCGQKQPPTAQKQPSASWKYSGVCFFVPAGTTARWKNITAKALRRKVFPSERVRRQVESPQRREAMWTLLQKSDRRKLLLQLCGHTTTGCGLGTGLRRRSRHTQKTKKKKKITQLVHSETDFFSDYMIKTEN